MFPIVMMTLIQSKGGGRDATGRRLSDAPILGPRFGAPGNFKHYAYQSVHLAV